MDQQDYLGRRCAEGLSLEMEQSYGGGVSLRLLRDPVTTPAVFGTEEALDLLWRLLLIEHKRELEELANLISRNKQR